MKLLKKLIIVAISLTTLTVFAAATGTVNLSAVVTGLNDMVVTALAKASALDIIGGEAGVKVASVSETSNNRVGYHITMYSVNAGKMVNAVDPLVFSPYTISYDAGASVAPPLQAAPVTVKTVSLLTGKTIDVSDVNITLTANPDAVSGTYADTITFSMVQN